MRNIFISCLTRLRRCRLEQTGSVWNPSACHYGSRIICQFLMLSRLAVNRGSRFDFTPRPTLFFLPAGFCCLVSSIEETLSARLSKLENYGFDQLVSQRDWHHLLNEKSGFWGTCLSWRDVRGRIYEGCVGEVANRMSGGSVRGGRWGYLPFRHHDNRYSAVWIRLYPGLSKNSEDGNSCSKSHKAARFDWSCGKSGQQWDWDYKPEYGYHHDETRCFGSEIWWFQRSEWTKRMSCGNFAAVRPKSHNNLILSFWLPVPAPWPRPSGFTTLRERCSEDSLAPFPHYRHYSPPPFNCLWKCFVPPLGRAGLRPAPQWHWTRRLLARAGYVSPCCNVMCLWYMCFCAEVFFFLFSDCTPNGA